MSADAQKIVEVLSERGALFFGELSRCTHVLPSRVESALAELVAQGIVTADGFEGMRALLLPEEKRAPFASTPQRRRYKTITSVEFGGRWSLLRKAGVSATNVPQDVNLNREEAVEALARVLLRRYGVVARRMMEKETMRVAWFELLRVFRRLEARGEIRGGYFVGGLSGEQFARPEAIELLRSLRKTEPKGELTAISAADPLNLVGILNPGPRIPAVAAHRILLRDGVPVAFLKAGQVTEINGQSAGSPRTIEQALRVGTMPLQLRPYYG